TPVAAVYPNGYDRAAGSAYLLTTSGSVMEFGCENKKAFVRQASLTLDQKYKRVYKMGNTVLGLTNDGRLFQVNGTTSAPLQTSVDGRVYEIAPTEGIQFFEN